MDILRNQRNTWKKILLLSACLFQLFYSHLSYADFINGGFESTYTPTNSPDSPITGWTQTGYLFTGDTASPPASFNDLGLSPVANGISDIISVANSGLTQTLYDYFLYGATPTPTLKLPIIGLQSAMINLRSIDAPLTKSGSGAAGAFALVPQQATAFSEQIVVQASDIDSTDGKVHIRFVAAPVLQNPGHPVSQQPFFAFQLNNITTGRTGSNPLFFQWNYTNQPSVPWQSITTPGTNPGSDTSYLYTNIQAYDISPGNAFIHVGDTIQLQAVASGCSPGGHDGHLYLDGVQTSIPYALWVTTTGPASATPGENITYTYTYTNATTSSISNVVVVANMPQQGTPVTSPAGSTTFVSVTNPTVGTSPSCSGTTPVTCNIGTLAPGQSGTFQLTVNIPSTWATSTGPVNNGDYPISGTGLNALLGPLFQTTLLLPSSLSNLVVNTSSLPTIAELGMTYSGTYTCSNVANSYATGNAPSASCDITNLPTGLSVSGCTITPSGASWTEPTDIPSGQTVTCSVTGTPTTNGAFTAVVSSNAANNTNSTTSQSDVAITVIGAPAIPATMNGSPILTPAILCCGRPVMLGPLTTPGSGPTIYSVIGHTGNVNCFIGHSGSQTYLKMEGSKGTCTISATKDGVTSLPLTIVAPS